MPTSDTPKPEAQQGQGEGGYSETFLRHNRNLQNYYQAETETERAACRKAASALANGKTREAQAAVRGLRRRVPS